MDFNEESVEKVTMGEWTWETGMNFNQITEFERIRDYGLLVVYSNWSYLKNFSSVKDDYKNRRLDWVAYIAGKRESRRLLGEVVGMAASVAADHQTNPRGVYQNHLDELKVLMKKGVGKYDVENMQNYNKGRTLGPKNE